MSKKPDFFSVPLLEICHQCGDEFLDHAKEHADMTPLMRWCRHTGTLVHASLAEHEGKWGIVRWTLQGPMSEAEAAHRPASQILRELMREFVQRQREAREYDEFLRRKVEAGRASMQVGQDRLNDEVEAEFAARRARVTRQL